MGRARIGRAPVEPADEFRMADIVDVEDHEAAMPVAGIKPVAAAQRVMAAMAAALPALALAAVRPLPLHPPARYRLGPRRVGEVEDHNDVADKAIFLRRDVGIGAVGIEAVRAQRLVMPDRARLGAVG